MAEINNSLALGVKPMEFDIAKPLEAAAKINSLRAGTAQTEQETGYRQFQQDQNGGYRVPDVNTRANTATTNSELRARAASEIFQDPSNSGVQRAIQHFESNGVPLDTLTKQKILSLPPEERKATALSIMRGGQPPGQTVEQTPGQVGQRSYMGTAGATAGAVGGDMPPVPPIPAMLPRAEGAPIRTNPDGSINGNIATVPARPAAGTAINPLAAKGVTEANNEQLRKNVEIGAEQYKGYQKAQEASGVTKIVLKSLVDDADRVYTGNAADQALNARKWIQAAQQLPGVGEIVKKLTANVDDPVAAAENIRKNVGIIAREAMGSLGGSAAAELDNITSSLPSQKMSGPGLKLAASQMLAIEDYKQARLRAADQWKETHGGSMDGFAADMAKNMGPGVFVMARLPKEEQVAITQRMQKTPEGKRTLASIHRQSLWVEHNHLEDVID